jgi:hypothetical protein
VIWEQMRYFPHADIIVTNPVSVNAFD